MTCIQKSGKEGADRRNFQEFASKLENFARIVSQSFGAADFNYWCCDNINSNGGAICYPNWNSWRIMLPSTLKVFVNTPEVIEKRQNLPIRKSKWKQNSNLENQVALPKVSCQKLSKNYTYTQILIKQTDYLYLWLKLLTWV